MQCRLQFGTKSGLCEHYPRQSEVCRALWCQRNGRECETKFLPAAEGTPCGKNKWCRKGVCVDHDVETTKVIDGKWSAFSPWSPCSRSCDGGLIVRERFCDSPAPSNGGSYCKGEEKEFKICNTQRCSTKGGEQRNDQCETFDKRTVKGKIYKWRPYEKDLGALSRCRIYCVPDKRDLYLVLSTKLQDGTSCNGNYSSVCVEGECRAVGCDGKVESDVVPDRCGICNGNNSTCKTIKGTFITSNLSIGYHEVVRIPSYSRHINISEEQEMPTYLALKNRTGQYQLNGNWSLNWPGRYYAAGAMFSYRRWSGKPESIFSKGPTNDDIIVEVLLQEITKILIHYEFVISYSKHHWMMENSTCSVTCGNGTFLSKPVCFTFSGNPINNIYCNKTQKPKIKSYICNEAKCLANWHVSEWSPCSSNRCDSGIQTRQAYCTENGVTVSDASCSPENRPLVLRECLKNNCEYLWFTGSWSKCRGKCSSAFQTRSITCRRSPRGTAESFSNCKEDAKPPHMRKCKRSDGCFKGELQRDSIWITGPWTQCEGPCGEETQERNVSCVSQTYASTQQSSSCNSILKPKSKQKCSLQNCSKSSVCEDTYTWCATSNTEKLCKLKFYAINCCVSCRKR